MAILCFCGKVGGETRHRDRIWQTSEEEQPRFGNGPNFRYRIKDRLRDRSVQPYQSHSLGANCSLPPTKREGGDVDSELA
jgi:hypothetical protein